MEEIRTIYDDLVEELGDPNRGVAVESENGVKPMTSQQRREIRRLQDRIVKEAGQTFRRDLNVLLPTS